MIRQIVGLLGVLAVIVPDRMIDVFEAVAIENPSECTPNRWIKPGIRAEGILITGASLLGGRAYAWLLNLTGVFGALLVVSPQVYRDLATRLVYESPEAVEWNDRFTDAVRIIGVVYVLMAIKALANRWRGE